MLGSAPPPTRSVRITDEEAARRMSISGTPPEDVQRMVKDANRAKGIKPSAPAPSAPSAYTRGLLVDGPSSAAGLSGSAFDALTRMGAKLPIVGGASQAVSGLGQTWGDDARRGLGSVVPIPDAPAKGDARTAQAAGSGTFFGLAGAPFAGPALAAGEVVLSTLGAAAGEDVKQATDSEGAGIVAELLASAGAPLIIGPKIISKSPQIAIAARRIVQSMTPSPEAARYAKALGVSVSDLSRAAGELKTFVPEHPSGGEQYIADWARYLDEAREQFDGDMPTTRQIIEARRDAGSSLASLEEGLGARSRDFSAKVAGRRQAVEDSLRAEVDQLRGGDPSILPTGFEQIQDMRWAAQRNQWNAVPPEEMPIVRTADLKEAAREAVERAGEFESDIPEEALRVLEWPDEVPWEQYQQMRSRMLKAQRVGSRGTAETMSQMKVDNRAVLVRGFKRELDRLVAESGEKGQAYRDAIRSTARFYDDFDPTSVVVRSYEDMTEPARAAVRIRSSSRPAEEAARAVRIFSQDPAQLAAFRTSILDDIIGPEDLSPGQAKSALKKLRANKNLVESVWGPSGYRTQENILERARTVSIGRTGKSAQAMSTGSGRGDPGAMAVPLAAMVDPMGTVTTKAMEAVLKGLGKSQVNSRILREAMLDPELGSMLLKMPEPRSVESWVINWNRLAARSALKTGARESAE
jgi:hypothetical protein